MLRLIRLLTIVIAVGTLLGVAALKVLGLPVARARVTAALESCTFEQIREGQNIASQFNQVKMAMLERSHKVRDDGKFQVWSTPQGEFRYAEPMSNLDAFVLAEEEFDIYRTYRIKPGFVVLDCGANIGTFTRRALDRGAAKVVAIEINPEEQEGLATDFCGRNPRWPGDRLPERRLGQRDGIGSARRFCGVASRRRPHPASGNDHRQDRRGTKFSLGRLHQDGHRGRGKKRAARGSGGSGEILAHHGDLRGALAG